MEFLVSLTFSSRYWNTLRDFTITSMLQKVPTLMSTGSFDLKDQSSYPECPGTVFMSISISKTEASSGNISSASEGFCSFRTASFLLTG